MYEASGDMQKDTTYEKIGHDPDNDKPYYGQLLQKGSGDDFVSRVAFQASDVDSIVRSFIMSCGDVRGVFGLRMVCRSWCEWMFRNYLSDLAKRDMDVRFRFRHRAQEALRCIGSRSMWPQHRAAKPPTPWNQLAAAKRHLDWPSDDGHAATISAISELAQPGDQDTIDILCNFMRGGGKGERYEALSGLSRIAPCDRKLWNKILTVALKDSSQDIRMLGCMRVRETTNAGDISVDSIISVLESCKGLEAKSEALQTLAHVAHPGDSDALDAALAFTTKKATRGDAEYSVRADALRAAAAIGPKNNPKIISRVLACTSDEWAVVTITAWKLLPKIVDEDNVLLVRLIAELLSSDKPSEQLQGLQLAGAFPQGICNDLRAKLVTLASSGNADIRYQVLRIICPRLKRKRRFALLCEEESSEDEGAALQQQVAVPYQVLACNLSLAMQLLSDKSPLVRFAAIGAVMRIVSQESNPNSNGDTTRIKLGLVGRLRDSMSDIRSRAIEGLHKLGYVFDSDVCPAIVSRLSDRIIDVAHRAARALKLGTPNSCVCSACDDSGEGSGCDTDEFAECADHDDEESVDNQRINLVPKRDVRWTCYISKQGLSDARDLLREGKAISCDMIKKAFVQPEYDDMNDDERLVAVDLRAIGVGKRRLRGIVATLSPEEAVEAFCRARDLFTAARGLPALAPELSAKELK